MSVAEYSDLDIELLVYLELSWKNWLSEIFPSYCKHPFSPYPGYHVDFWQWVWSVKRGEKPPAFLTIWPRRGAKSTSIELASVALGCQDKRKYALYISGTQDQADDHVTNVGALLENPMLGAYYPAMAARRVGKHGNIRGWRRNRLWTQSGFVIDALGLDAAARGAKLEEQRPDLIIFDDIDDHKDSPGVTENKKETLGKSILPAGSDDAAIVGAQNLVHRNSIFAQMLDGRFPALANRVEAEAIPALLNFEYKREGRRTIIAGGLPTWEGLDVSACQKLIDDFTIDYFLSECQHAVKLPEAGAIYPMWSDVDPVIGGDRSGAHVISWSQFEKRFNLRSIPPHWKLARGQDWGATAGHPCVTTWMARAAENAPKFSYREGEKIKSYPLRGKIFAYRELTAFKQTPRQIAEQIIAAEEEFQEADRIEISITGHDNKGARDTYAVHHNLAFETAKPDKCGGIAQMLDYLQIDKSVPHPFKQDRLLSDGTYEIGCPSIFYVVSDEQLAAPLDDAGFLRHRQEFPSYHYDEPAEGEELHRLEPYSFYNDSMDSDRMIASKFFPSLQELSPEEQFEAAMPEALKAEKIEEMNAEEKGRAWQMREFRRVRMEKEAESENNFDWIYKRRRGK